MFSFCKLLFPSLIRLASQFSFILNIIGYCYSIFFSVHNIIFIRMLNQRFCEVLWNFYFLSFVSLFFDSKLLVVKPFLFQSCMNYIYEPKLYDFLKDENYFELYDFVFYKNIMYFLVLKLGLKFKFYQV